MHYIFDVDGTLTPSRQKIAPEFKEWLMDFFWQNKVYIATGSDNPKTVEQLGSDLYNLTDRCYNCNGNDVWEGVYNTHSEPTGSFDFLEEDLYELLEESKSPIKKGRHIEKRPGMVNFSIPGRSITLEDRSLYKQWDKEQGERDYMANFLSEKYPGLNFSVAGDTGLDITKRGKDKAQILLDFEEPQNVMFFGDKMEQGGNDHTLSLAVVRNGGSVRQVKSWKDTWKILKQLSE